MNALAMACPRRRRGKARKSLDLIDACRTILAEIQPATVRSVCYRLFTLKLIPSMAKNETNRVGGLLVDARKSGAIPWEWVVDEMRAPERVQTWNNPAEYVRAVRHSYRRDRWALQSRRVEVWSEKGTVRGTLLPVLEEFGVTLRVFHGFTSATSIHEIAMETAWISSPLLALYVGDFDPSGMRMSAADLPDRLREGGACVTVERIAITEMDLLNDDMTLSTFPLADKMKDSRATWFGNRYGDFCAELDALSPVILRARIEAGITAAIDWDAWNRCGVADAAEVDSLGRYMDRWVRSNSRPARKYPEGA